MTRSDIAWRLTLAVPIWLAVFGLVSHVLLILEAPRPGFLFPLSALAGIGLAFIPRVGSGAPPLQAHEPGPRWLPWVCVAVLIAAVGSVVVGALATEPRIWDGFVSWSLRASYYAPGNEGLAELVTGRPGFFVHSRSYPLLQPLCLGASRHLLGAPLGNLFFPLIFVAFIALLGQTGRRVGMPAAHAWLLALCFGLTPMWFSTGSGAVDSGYAELLLGYGLCVFAAGAALASAPLIAIGGFLLPLIKPEGLVYGVVLCTALPFVAGRRLHRYATLGLTLALVCWLPIANELLNVSAGTASSFWLTAALAGGGFVTVQIVLGEWVHRVKPTLRTLVLVAVGSTVLVVLAATLFLGDLAARGHPIAIALHELPQSLPSRFAKIPELTLGYVEGLTFVRKYGIVFILAIALLLLPRDRFGGSPSRALPVLLCLGVSLTCAAMLVGPPDNLDHEFKSRYDRLLLHWVGVAWLTIGPWLSKPTRSESDATRIWANRPSAA